ncbi:MAG: transglutaminase-like domain-containing protein [Acutalibacteraceae bacterium]|jgi:hypothetical protein
MSKLSSRNKMTLSHWMELLLDSLCCIAMAIGGMLAFDQLFRFHVDIWTMAYHAAIIVAVLALGTRRWWILPSVIGGALVLGVIGTLIAGKMGELITYAVGVANWWAATFPVGSKYYTDFNVALVEWIVHILITSFLFLCVRGIKQVWTMIVVAAILFYIIIVSGFSGNNLMALLWLATGMFPLMARYASAGMPWMKGRSKKERKESRKQWRKPAWYVYATAVVLTAACTMVSMLLLPENTKSYKVRSLANTAEDIQSLIGIENKMYTGFEDISLQGLGLMPDEDQLGGDIVLDDKTNILKVVTETPSLLKGRVYTTYDGTNWSADAFSKYYRLGSGLFTDEYYAAFDLNKPESEAAKTLLTFLGPNVGMTVTVLQPTNSLLYTSGRVLSFQEKVPASSPVLFNMRSEVFINDEPVPSGYQYTFTSQLMSHGNPVFNKNIKELLTEADKNPDVTYYSEEFQKIYLDVPPDMPPIVAQKAQELTKGKISKYEIAVGLESALREQYSYSLTPGDLPEGEDFVAHFLETGRGYCVHFASAMTMMARTLEIPARMVVGYGLEQDQKGDLWYARRRNAHAWTECYFEGLGWVAFDPTADSQYANLTPDVEYIETTETATTTSGTKFNDTGPTGTNTSAVVDKSGEGTPAWVIHTTITVLAVLLLVALTVLTLRRLRYSETAYLPERVQKKYPEPGDQADFYYTDIVRQLKLLHYVPQNRETMKQFAQRVELGVGLEPDAMRQVFDVMMRWRYGKIAPTEEEVALVETAHEHLEKRVYDKFNRAHYFIRRRLML